MDWTTQGLGLRIGGHRGAAGAAPENTLAGFELAAAAGVDYLELDVQLSADGVALVFHDEVLDRTTSGSGPFAAARSEELLALDAGAWFGSRFAGERIPTLAGFLDWLARRPGLGATLEAKGPHTGAAIAGAIAASPVRSQLSICSFRIDELEAAVAVDPTIPRMLIVDRDERPDDLVALSTGVDAVNVPGHWLDAAAVAALHEAGVLIGGGTVDDAGGLQACLALGIDLVDSNQPGIAVAARDAALADRAWVG